MINYAVWLKWVFILGDEMINKYFLYNVFLAVKQFGRVT